MSTPLVLRVSISPANLARLNRGETVAYVGKVHPDFTVELVPQTRAAVPAPPQPPARAAGAEA